MDEANYLLLKTLTLFVDKIEIRLNLLSNAVRRVWLRISFIYWETLTLVLTLIFVVIPA